MAIIREQKPGTVPYPNIIKKSCGKKANSRNITRILTETLSNNSAVIL